MIKGAIIGGAGYTGGELLRLSLQHPDLEITEIISRSNAGKKVTYVHTDLLGDTELVFQPSLTMDPDVLFLCMGHGNSESFVNEYQGKAKCIVDLSQDFRLEGANHSFQYGLPEAFKREISKSSRVANPGCFATAIQLGLLPLAKESKLTNDIHIHALTGSTGAGQGLSATTHFSWRNNNVSTYKVFEHQHLAEIRQTLTGLQFGEVPPLHFVPVRGAFTRGIYASMYTKYNGTQSAAIELYKSYYFDHPFVIITDQNPDLKQVVNTNKCIIYIQQKEEYLYIVSMIDNLIKGAVGQAVQNMNLVFGLKETTGLKFKCSAF